MQKFSRAIKYAIFLIPLLLNGCNNSSIEVRDRAFVQAIGVDYQDEPAVAVSIFGNEENCAFTGKGQSIFEAIADAETKQDKNLFTGHIELIALGKGKLKTGLETLLTNSRITPSCNIIYCDDSAADLISDKNSLTLLETVKIKSKNGYISRKSISNVLDDMLGSDKKAAIPIVGNDEIHMAVINENGLTGTLSDEEAQGFSWLSGTIKTLTMPLDINDETVNIRIEKAKNRVISKVKNGKVTTKFRITFSGTVLEKNYTSDEVKDIAEKKIISLCQAVVNRTVKDFHSDVFNIEKSIKTADYDYYCQHKDNWDELLQSIDFEYDVKLMK